MKGYETLERVKLICDEKEKQFQGDKLIEEYLPNWDQRLGVGAVVWKMFFNFQLELLKAEAEGVPATESVVDDAFASAYLKEIKKAYAPYGGRDRDQMEAAAVKAEEPFIGKSVPHNPDINGTRATHHYFYPQDISEAQEGDIWHDLDGRPHFCLGCGWIEARGFMPNVAEGQLVEVSGHDKSDNKGFVSKLLWELRFGIEQFKLA